MTSQGGRFPHFSIYFFYHYYYTIMPIIFTMSQIMKFMSNYCVANVLQSPLAIL